MKCFMLSSSLGWFFLMVRFGSNESSWDISDIFLVSFYLKAWFRCAILFVNLKLTKLKNPKQIQGLKLKRKAPNWLPEYELCNAVYVVSVPVLIYIIGFFLCYDCSISEAWVFLPFHQLVQMQQSSIMHHGQKRVPNLIQTEYIFSTREHRFVKCLQQFTSKNEIIIISLKHCLNLCF